MKKTVLALILTLTLAPWAHAQTVKGILTGSNGAELGTQANPIYTSGGGGADQISELSDISSSTASAGRLLIGQGTTFGSMAMSGDATINAQGVLTLTAGPGAAATLSDLSDVGATTATAGRILVGAGTSFESAALHGDIASIDAEGTVDISAITGDLSISTSVVDVGGTGIFRINASTSDVGIGTSAPAYPIDLYANGATALGIDSSGQVFGDPLDDQFTYMQAGNLLSILSDPRFIYGWITPSDAGTEQDLTVNNHDATYVDASDWSSSSQLAKSLSWTLDFNGTTAYLTLGDSTDFSFGDGSTDSPFSVGAWVEIVNTAATQYIITKWTATTGVEAEEWRLRLSTSEQVFLDLRDESANVSCAYQTTAGLSVGWHHIVATYDGAGGATACTNAHIYVDGAEPAGSASNNGSYVAMENLSTSVFIGAATDAAAVGGFFQGDMGMPFLEGWEMSSTDAWNLYIRTRGFYNL